VSFDEMVRQGRIFRFDLTKAYTCIALKASPKDIYRQTLLYRLEKIETLTGLSLNSHRNLFLLELCIKSLSGYTE